MTRRARTAALATVALVSAAGGAAPADGAGAARATSAHVRVMTVFRSGAASARTTGLGGVMVRVAGRRCAVPRGTPLAVLVRSRPGAIGLRDFGSCSRRAADAGGLFVRSIRSDRNRGNNGWVYKVGNRLGTAGAGDPAGPFGRRRLRSGQRVTWFYCIHRKGCQRTLTLRATALIGGIVSVKVRGYDDDAKGVAVSGARISSAGRSAITDSSGFAQLRLPAGSHLVRATKAGLVRSFGERVTVP